MAQLQISRGRGIGYGLGQAYTAIDTWIWRGSVFVFVVACMAAVFWLRKAKDAHCRIAVVPWHGVASPIKVRKHGLSRGIVADIDMLSDLFRCASAWQLLRQIMSMRRQRVRSAQAIGHVALRVRSD